MLEQRRVSGLSCEFAACISASALSDISDGSRGTYLCVEVCFSDEDQKGRIYVATQ